jgi:hypothetical protein
MQREDSTKCLDVTTVTISIRWGPGEMDGDYVIVPFLRRPTGVVLSRGSMLVGRTQSENFLL